MACKFDLYLLMMVLLTLLTNLVTQPNLLRTFFYHNSDFNVTHDTTLSQESHVKASTKGSGSNLNISRQTTRSPFWQEDYFTISTSNVKAVYAHQRYCSARCYGSVLLLPNSYGVGQDTNLMCVPCNCKKPQCKQCGTCCPNMARRGGLGIVEKTVKTTICPEIKEMTFGCDCSSVQDTSFLYVRSCPRDFLDQSVRALCTVDVPDDEQTPATFARVSDNKTNTVYYNKYCAECNGVPDHIPWQIIVSCQHYLDTYSAMNKDEFLRLSLDDSSSCQANQKHSSGLVLRPCRSDWYRQAIGYCNTTAQWSEPDEDVRKVSVNNTDFTIDNTISEQHTRGLYYKNILCSICPSEVVDGHFYACNFNDNVTKCCFFTIIFPEFACAVSFQRGKVLPFSMLLGSIRNILDSKPHDSELEFGKCAPSEWPSPDRRCLPLQCSPGKYLRGEKCITALNDIRGLGYMVRIFYLPNKIPRPECSSHCQSRHVGDTPKLLNLFITHLLNQRIMDPTIAETQLKAVCVRKEIDFFHNSTIASHVTPSDLLMTPGSASASNNPLFQDSDFFFYLEAHVVPNISTPRDFFENDILLMLMVNIPDLQTEGNITMSLTPLFMPDGTDLSNHSDQLDNEEPEYADVQTAVISNSQYSTNTAWNYKHKFLSLSPVLTCTHVSFNKSEYTVSVNCTTFPPTWRISLHLGHNTTLIFSDSSELNKLAVDNGHMRICLDLLVKKTKELGKHNKQVALELSDVFLWLYYLTHVCLSMSMLSLFITVLTFSLFASLRNVAGINNMFLSATLFLAQASLLSSYHVEGPSLVCTALGISTHFLWLSMTSWSFICCFHMFCVFTAATRILKSSGISQRKCLIKKVLVSVLAPIFVIATVMLTTFFTSDGERIGYTDSNPCYLDTSLLAMLSFAAPLALVTVVNFFFFAVTIHRIYNVKRLQTHTTFRKNERDTFIIYVKLSTMTGVFWVVAIVSEQVDSDPLRFVAIILNGLQGVFLFVSFVCNKRVLRMLVQDLLRPQVSTSTNVSSKTGDSGQRSVDKSSTF